MTAQGNSLNCWSRVQGQHGCHRVGGLCHPRRVDLGRAPWNQQQQYLGRCWGATVAPGSHHGTPQGGTQPGLGLLGTNRVLGMGQVVNSFSPPSILCRHVIEIIMTNPRGCMGSCIKS